MEETDDLFHLLRWNVSEMHRRFFFPQAYADPIKVADERHKAMALREIFSRSNLRDIHDRALRTSRGNVTFGFWAPLTVLDHVMYTPRHAEIALNARVQYKVAAQGSDGERVYVIVAPWIPNYDGADADAFYITSFHSARLFAQATWVFFALLLFFALLWLIEGPPRMIYVLVAAAVLYGVMYVALLFVRRAYIHRRMASFEQLLVNSTAEAFL